MSGTHRIRILDDVLAGRLHLADAAWQLETDEAGIKEMLKKYSLHGAAAVSDGILGRIRRSLAARRQALWFHLHSYPAMRRLKLKAAYSLASFAILAIGVLMLGACSSVFPGESRAAERDEAVRRLESRLRYRSLEGVDRQLKQAGSVYDRVLKVLETSSGAGAERMRQRILARRQNLTRIRTRCLREGLPERSAPAVADSPGAIYERMLDVLPADQLKKMTPLAVEIVERAQNGETRLQKIGKFYRSALKQPRDHYGKIVRQLAQSPAEKAQKAGRSVASAAAVPAEPVREIVGQRLQQLHAQEERARLRGMNARRYRPFTRMPVISRFNRGNQILRTLEKGAGLNLELI